MRHYLSPLLARALATIGAPADTELILDYPRRKDLGDLSTGLAHRTAAMLGRPAPEIAAEIVAALEHDPRFLSVDIAPNGFINFRFLPPFFHMRLEEMPTLSSEVRVIWNFLLRRRTVLVFKSENDRAAGESIERMMKKSEEEHGEPVRFLLINPMPPSIPVEEVSSEVGREMIDFLRMTAPPMPIMVIYRDQLHEHSERNPLRYLQYTHFRIAGIIRHAASEGYPLNRHASPEPLTHPREIDLIRSLLPFPDAVERAMSEENPGIIAAYLRELAESVNAFHAAQRIIGEPGPVRDARLRLLDAAGMMVRRGLEMIGMRVIDRV
ncbi:MAG: DALR anticodon-binding domain-containing protein [Bacteroidota bacterium]